MNSNVAKGNYLEEAVERIQRLILEINPSLKKAHFILERKKIIFPGGTKKEIDLFVSVDPGNGFESIFIFECKNWDKPVPQSEIVIFNTKIQDTNATKGFFIAKKFSKYAELEANKYPRIKLLKADANYITDGLFPEIHTVHRNKTQQIVKLEVSAYDSKGDNVRLEKVVPCLVKLDGLEMKPKVYFNSIVESLVNERLKKEPTHTFIEGVYPYSITKNLQYERERLYIDEVHVEEISVLIDFTIDIIKPVLVSKFDIETKGRYLHQTMKIPDGGIFNVKFVDVNR